MNNLSDEDGRKMAEELEGRLVNRFFINLGQGFWALAWRGIVLILLAVAAYGAFKGFSK